MESTDDGFTYRATATAGSGSASPSIVEGLNQRVAANPAVRPNYTFIRRATDSSQPLRPNIVGKVLPPRKKARADPLIRNRLSKRP